MSDEDILLIKEKLRNLENQQLDKFQRNIKALSYITYLCQKNNILPILVGGHAVIGIEDLILDRIRSAVYWNSPRDKEWAYLMMGAHKSNIDYLYLEKMAQQETSAKIYELVLELKNQIANENQI